MRFSVMLAAACLIAAGGCGSDGKVATAGRVVRGGEVLSFADDESLMVIFYQLNPDGSMGKNTFYATTSETDGTFKASGPDGRGVPPGKYRISVEHLKKKKDVLKGAFNGDKSPFVFDIDAGTPELVLDIAKKS